jgi:hypothetical protein
VCILLDVESQERQVENQSNPVAIDEEQESKETMNSSFWDDVGVQAVAKVDGVDVVTAMGIVSTKSLSTGKPAMTRDQIMALVARQRQLNLPLKITVHNGEEHLQEQVDGIDQHRQKKQPCLSRHHDGL